MSFDVEGARKAGYTDAEIADHLSQSSGFDLKGARGSGYSDSEVIAHLATGSAMKAPKPTVLERLKEAVTGAQRRTEQTETLGDWADMPELNSFSLASAKAGLGTLLASPDEAIQVIKANFPGVQVAQDDKGNYLLTSSIDGKQYAIKPGFRPSDIPRAAGAVAAFTPAGRAATIPGMMAGAGLTQAAIEASQAATGGEFNPGDVAAAAATAGVVPVVGTAVRAVAAPIRAGLSRAAGAAAPEAPAAAALPGPAAAGQPAGAAVVPATTAPVAAPVAQLATDELGQTMRTAALGGIGSKKATKALAEAAAPDAETVAAARRLGIEEHLQPDHVTTSQAFRQLSQLVKSQTGSTAAVAQREGLERVAGRASALVEEIGGTADASALSSTVRARMESTVRELEKRSNALYDEVRAGVPSTTGAPARNVLEFVEKRAKDLGGRQNLTPMEKQIVAKLEPKPATGGRVQPTYALLDDVRKDLGAAARAAGPFKDADTGLAKKLYGLLSDDQAAVVERLGVKETYDAARQSVAVRKGIEDDMASIFGKQLDRSMVPLLSGAVKKLGAGDTASFVKLIGAVPQEMRQQVTASGLSSFFQRTTRGGEMDFAGYARWFEGLQRNQQAHAALMSNLPRGAAQQLSDLARVARGVAMSKGEFLATGKAINPKVLEAADSLMGRVYDEVRRRGVSGLAAEAIGTTAGAPGLASALASATMANKPSIVQAADRLIASPEFIAAARAAGTKQQAQAARALAYSKPFTRFVRAIGQPRELSNRERWVMQALQSRNNLNDEGSDARN